MKEKYVMDIKQGQTIALDLLESIMKPSCLVQEELQKTSLKRNQGFNFLDVEKNNRFTRRPTQQASP